MRLRVRTAGRGNGTAGREDGAAVAEFVMISVLLVFLLFGVLQVALYCYARNIIAASAADGARYAASVGHDPVDGGRRASDLISDGLTAADAADIPCTGSAGVDAESGLPVTTVRCHGRLQALFLPMDLPLTIDVTSSALTEGAP